ncbi:hemopexin repeat-containing protein [Streptomyces laculatispora]|uniref:Hemopexin repeat-containing protein n=1 Tax=Streptomyces laculatispora TaxID=887464 RepID=A0ABY9IDR6_9ACTN|nr:hemopexin repeat-containing protein [Streptomyces laculatispora]WLQ45051.1 hemopexin repeat-containing protein [Streptomyces laculatispora]
MSDRAAYFFKGDRYLRYNITNDTVDVDPTEISDNWPALPTEFQNDLDTVVDWDEA